MTQNPDVAAVLAEALRKRFPDMLQWKELRSNLAAEEILAALTAVNARVLFVPEGVAVEHGAPLWKALMALGEWAEREATP